MRDTPDETRSHSHVRGDRTRRYGVDLDVVLGPLVAQRLGHLRHATFGGRVCRDALTADEGVQGGDVQDFALPAGDHVPAGGLADEEQGLEIDIEDLVHTRVLVELTRLGI